MENLSELEIECLKTAYPFGGSATEDQYTTLQKLESMGYIEVVCKDHNIEGVFYGYIIKSKGKQYLKTQYFKIDQ